jgi:hypothetical protein
VKSMMDINTAAIIVGTNGFVWYTPQVIEADDHLTLVDARIIRVWGTDKGLAQLVTGPRKDTLTDTAATVILPRSAFVFAIPCSAWSIK